MTGLDATTGKAIADDAHLAQSMSNTVRLSLGMRRVLSRVRDVILPVPERLATRHTAELPNGGETFTQDRGATRFTLTGAIERSAHLGTASGQAILLVAGAKDDIAEAKALLAYALGRVHLEHPSPSWGEIHAALDALLDGNLP